MSEVKLGCSLIHRFKYNFTEEYIKTIVGKLKFASIPLETGVAASSVNDLDCKPHEIEENADFLKWLNEKVREVFIDWEYPSRLPYYFYNSWANVHHKTGQTEEHNHALTNMVVSCYLKCPENSGNILFRDPIHDYRSMEPIMSGSNPWREIKVTTGDVLIFPGWLYHKTQPSSIDESRIVCTYNIKTDFQINTI